MLKYAIAHLDHQQVGTAETNFLTDKKGKYVVHKLVHNRYTI